MGTTSKSSIPYYLIFEFIFIFFVLPITVLKQWVPVSFSILPLYLIALFAVTWFIKTKQIPIKRIWCGKNGINNKAVLISVALRLIVVSILVFSVVYIFYPEKLFNFPLQHPLIWVLVLLLYPPLSVLPQEIVYRAFFFERYKYIFKTKKFMIIANIFMFSFMHIVFENTFVIVATLIGGYFFATTYSRTNSIRWVLFEHSLYGYVIFTFGLGEFFLLGMSQTLLS